VSKVDNLATIMCRLPSNLGASFSWNAQDLTSPVQRLLYLYYYKKLVKVKIKLNFILEQAKKAQRGSRGIAVLFL